ncbi:MAG: hypothetical protein AAFR18_12025 [Cyanobacteria bacterium J06627_32]
MDSRKGINIQGVKYLLETCEMLSPITMMQDASLNTRAFIEIASGKPHQGYYSLEALYGRKWNEDEPIVLDFFLNCLDDDSRVESLIFYTSYIHELTHHTDMMITPFGVNYHGKLCREYISFQDFGKALLNSQNLIKEFGRIPDFEDPACQNLEQSDNEKLYSAWASLKGQIYYFDAAFNTYGWGQRNTTEGWAGNTTPALVFNQRFKKITVRDFFLSINIPNQKEYLTANTILECRAVINSIQWIYWTIGDIPECKNTILVYLENVYLQGKSQQENVVYTFILNLFAKFGGCSNIQTWIQEHSLKELSEMLETINSCCWYALQAPPPMNKSSLHNSSPVSRLLLSLVLLEEGLMTGSFFEHAPQMLRSFDNSQSALDLFFQPIDKILAYCLQYLMYCKHLNKNNNKNRLLREHYERVINIQINQISKRIASDFPYSSLVGLAETGNPLFGILEEDADSLLFDYAPHNQIKEWASDRHTLLFKVSEKTKVIDILNRWFST